MSSKWIFRLGSIGDAKDIIRHLGLVIELTYFKLAQSVLFRLMGATRLSWVAHRSNIRKLLTDFLAEVCTQVSNRDTVMKHVEFKNLGNASGYCPDRISREICEKNIPISVWGRLYPPNSTAYLPLSRISIMSQGLR